METIFWSVVQIVFVTIIYTVAYRNGFNASRKRAEAIVEAFSYPVSELMDRIDEEIDRAVTQVDYADAGMRRGERRPPNRG